MSDKDVDKSQVRILSTKLQIEDFLENSFVWKDIQRELKIWLEGFNKEKDGIVDNAATTNPSTASVLMHLGDLNGREKAIKYVLALPHMLLDILGDIEKDDKEDN